MKKIIVLAVLVILAVIGTAGWQYSQGNFIIQSPNSLILGTGSGSTDVYLKNTGGALVMINSGVTIDAPSNTGGIASVYSCGTTTTCAAAAAVNNIKEVYGTVTLSAGAATLASLPFTSTSSFGCTGTDQTATAAVKIVPASASTATFAGTTTDVVFYHCIGT